MQSNFQTKPGFVDRRLKLMAHHNSKEWDRIYESYSGCSDLLDFIDWLKLNYCAPAPIITQNHDTTQD